MGGGVPSGFPSPVRCAATLLQSFRPYVSFPCSVCCNTVAALPPPMSPSPVRCATTLLQSFRPLCLLTLFGVLQCHCSSFLQCARWCPHPKLLLCFLCHLLKLIVHTSAIHAHPAPYSFNISTDTPLVKHVPQRGVRSSGLQGSLQIFSRELILQ